MKFIFFTISIILLIFVSCNSDTSIELSGGYFLRDEGKDMHDILNHSPDFKEIPADIISYGFDTDFIIASQKPSNTPDPLYKSEPIYRDGKNAIYYWIIVNKDKNVIGPMTEKEFGEAKIKLKVPEKLQLSPID